MFQEYIEWLKSRVAKPEKKTLQESNRGPPTEGRAGGICSVIV